MPYYPPAPVLGSTFPSVTLTDVVSRIIPGATSFAIRDHANAVDNFLITDAGSLAVVGKVGSGSGIAGSGHTLVTGAGGGGNADGGDLVVTLGANTGTGASGQLVITSSSVAGQTAMGDIHTFTHTFATLSAPYGTSADATRMLAINIETDLSANGYAGILNTFIARLNVNGSGGTIYKAEVISGVLNIKPGSLSDLTSGGYVTDGEILHNSSQTITGTLRAIQGTVGVNSSGSFTTVYAGDFSLTDTLGQSGTYTNTAQAIYGHVIHAAATTWVTVTATSGEVFLTGTGTHSGQTKAFLGWIHNSANGTYTGDTAAIHGLSTMSGAVVTSANVFAGQFLNQFQGTVVGGTTNAAINAEIQWSSLSNPTGSIYAAQLRWRVNSTTPFVTVAVAEALHILAPNFTAGNAVTAARAVHILNQGVAGVVTAEAIRIDAQTGATTNTAIVSLGGGVSLIVGNTIVSGTSAVWNGFTIPASTATITGVANITTATGFNLVTLAQPILSNASIVVTHSATLAIAGAPTVTGGMTLTNAYALWVQAGLTLLQAVTVAGILTMTTATSTLVPGATSFSIRNSANSQDNFIITDAGISTFINAINVNAPNSTNTIFDLKDSGARDILTIRTQLPNNPPAATNILYTVGQFPSTMTAAVDAYIYHIRGIGQGSDTGAGQSVLRVHFVTASDFATPWNTNYTGNQLTAAINGSNDSTGVGVTYVANFVGNVGGVFQSAAIATGVNIGVYGRAMKSTTLNIGALGVATGSANSEVWNVGVMGVARLAAQISNSGYFYVGTGEPTMGTSSCVTFDTAALAVDMIHGIFNAGNVWTVTARGTWSIVPTATAGGVTAFSLTPPNTGTIAAETLSFTILGNTLTVTTNYATQRFSYFRQPTLSAATAKTVTTAATVAIEGQPLATGAGPATITTPLAFWVMAGVSKFDGLVQTIASATGGAGLNLPHGAAPTSPVNGDVWTTTAGIFVRVNGATVGPLS